MPFGEFKPTDVMEYLKPYIRMADNHYHDDSRLNGIVIAKNDLHRLSAWRTNKVQSVTLEALDNILSSYRLNLADFELFLEEKYERERVG